MEKLTLTELFTAQSVGSADFVFKKMEKKRKHHIKLIKI